MTGLPRRTRVLWVLALLAVLAGGTALRMYGLDWAPGDSPHPDENMVMIAAHRISAPNFDPDFFAYGSLPLYIYRFTSMLLESSARTHRGWEFLSVDRYLVGRFISSLFGCLTLIVTFLLGRRLFGLRAGVLGTAFLAFSVLHIKLSHFLTVDIILTFYMMTALYFAAGVLMRVRLSDYILTGLCFGMAMATKISAFPVAAAIAVAFVLGIIRRRRILTRAWLYGILMPIIAIAAFMVCQPQSAIKFDKFFADVSYQAEMVRGVNIPWYVLHYEDSTPLIYQVKNFLLWGTGAPLGVFLLFALVITLYWGVRRLDTRFLYLHSFALPYFTMVFVLAHVKFMRYQIPIFPVLAILGGALVTGLIGRIKHVKAQHAIVAVTAGVMVSAVLYSLSLMALYQPPSTRISAVKWIGENIPSGSTILHQAMDMNLPYNKIKAFQRRNIYDFVEINIVQEPNNRRALEDFCNQIAKCDYIILPNPGHYNLVLSDPKRHPRVVKYFKNLFAGTLGFTLEQTFGFGFKLGPFELDSSLSDVEFYFFDHPKVQIFKKTSTVSPSEMANLIDNPPDEVAALTKRDLLMARSEQPVATKYRQTSPPDTQQKEQQQKKIRLWPDKGFPLAISWYLAVQLLALIALPITLVVFRNLPGWGYGFSKAFGLIVTSWISWILLSFHVLTYNRGAVLVAMLILGYVSLFFLLRNNRLVRTFWSDKRLRRSAYFAEGIFLATYLLWVVIRAYTPDIHGWERPSEFAYYNAVNRTELFPPYDPWISGEPLNYYYYCWHLFVSLSKLLGMETHYSYTLGIPMVTGLVAVAAFAFALLATGRRRDGLFAVVAINVMGNFDAIRQVLNNKRLFPFDWFRSAHSPIETTISEFPFWSYLYGDLHPHVVVIIPVLVFLGFLYKILHSRSEGAKRFGTGWERALFIGLMMIFLGTIFATNTWDYPTQCLLLFAVLYVQQWRVHQQRQLGAIPPGYVLSYGESRLPQWQPLIDRIFKWLWRVITQAGLPSIAIALGAFALFAPYQMNFTKSPPVSVDLTLEVSRNVLRTFTSKLTEVMVVFGHFMFVIVIALLLLEMQFTRERKRNAWIRFVSLTVFWGVLAGLHYLIRYQMPGLAQWLGDHNLGFLERYTFQLNYATVLFTTAVLYSTVRLIFLREGPDYTRMGLILTLMSVGIIWGDDIIYVQDFLGGGDWRRMNSVFKFHFQACTLFSASLPLLYRTMRTRFAWEAWEPVARRWLLVLWTVVTTALWILQGGRAWVPLTNSPPSPATKATLKGFFNGTTFMPISIPIAATVILACILIWRQSRRTYRQFHQPATRTLTKLRRSFMGFMFDATELTAVALFTAVCVFAFTGTNQKIREKSNGRGDIPTLNGLAFMTRTDPDQYDAIIWLREHVKGNPVLLETTGKSYMEFSRISMNTGLPTLLGWASHVYSKGYSWDEVFSHSKAIDTIYDTTDINETMKLIREFDIALIYVGNLERERHDPFGLQKFDRYPNLFNPVFRNSKVAIYEVLGHEYARVAEDAKAESRPSFDSASMMVGGGGDEAGQFRQPQGVALDKAGNFYVADSANHRIQKFSSDGRFRAQWGKQGSGDVELNWPCGITVSTDGAVFVADTWNHRVQKFSDNGKYLLTFSGPSQPLYTPRGLLASSDGKVFVADTGNNRIVVYSADGVFIETWGENGSGDGQFRTPTSVAMDADGAIYVADVGNERIQVFDKDGAYLRQWPVKGWAGTGLISAYIDVDRRQQVIASSPLAGKILAFSSKGEDITSSLFGDMAARFQQPAGLAVSGRDVYVADAGTARIDRLVKEEPVNMFTGGEGAKAGQFVQPRGIAVGPNGSVYTIDFRNYRVQHFTADGEFIYKWGSEGDDASQFNDPCGIAVDGDGNVYVADTWNARIQKFNANGELLRVWQGDAGGFYAVRDVEVDTRRDRVYAVDTGNARVQVFNRAGQFIGVWGGRGSGQGQFSEPVGIAVGPDSRIYVADTGNQRIQILRPDGSYDSQINVPEWKDPGQEAYLDVDPEGNVYVTIPGRDMVVRYDGSGQRTGALRAPRGAAKWNTPAGLAIAPDGSIYVMEMMEPKVRKLSPRDFH